MSDQTQVESTKVAVSAEALLDTYVQMWNDSNGTATLEDVAEVLDMNVNNVYQRISKIRNDLRINGVNLPPMKRSNAPRKNRARTDYAKLAALAKTIRVVDPVETV